MRSKSNNQTGIRPVRMYTLETRPETTKSRIMIDKTDIKTFVDWQKKRYWTEIEMKTSDRVMI